MTHLRCGQGLRWGSIALPLLVTAYVGCATSPRASVTPDAGIDDAGLDAGATLACDQTDGACSCTMKSGGAPSRTPCFADKRPGNESSNVCCAKNFSGDTPSAESFRPDYECSCGPSAPSTWRCYRDKDTCTCYGSVGDSPTNLTLDVGIEIPPSECVSKKGYKCGYASTLARCSCSDNEDANGSGATWVDSCAAIPEGRTLTGCPPGLKRVDACDGDCHPETCFGSAGEACSTGRCTPLEWTCIGNRCERR